MEKSIVDFSKLSPEVLDEFEIQKYDSFEDVFEDVYMDDDVFSKRDAVELLKDSTMQEVVEMQPYIYLCDGKYYRWPDAWCLEDDLIEQYPFARVSEPVCMSLTREQVEMYFKNQGRPDADEAWYDEFLNAGERQSIYDEIVENNYDLSDVDRWFHLMKVMGVEMKFETATSINTALWEEDIETMELQKEGAVDNKIKIDLGFATLVAEKGADPNYKEFFIGLENENGMFYQDIAVIGEKYHYEGDKVVPDKGISVRVYSDETQEDYTHNFDIGIYEGDEVEPKYKMAILLPVYTSEDINESYTQRLEFDSPEELIQAYSEIEEGTWCIVQVNGKVIMEGSAVPDDIETLEEYFAEGWDKTLNRNEKSSLAEKIGQASSRVEEKNEKNHSNDLSR